MNEFEISYYLDRQQLLLLLSLIDQRPVVGIPYIEEPGDWRGVSLSLLQNGLLYCEKEQLVMDECLSELLLALKAPERICAIYGKQPGPTSYVMYSGERTTLLEFLPDGKVRLRQSEIAELKEIVLTILMPPYSMPEALLTSLPDDEILQECLARWESQPIAQTDSAACWMQIDEVRGVLECQTRETWMRWVWIEDAAAGFILRQNQNGTQVALDTAMQRQLSLRELGLEA